jgi:hypothetical protein
MMALVSMPSLMPLPVIEEAAKWMTSRVSLMELYGHGMTSYLYSRVRMAVIVHEGKYCFYHMNSRLISQK